MKKLILCLSIAISCSYTFGQHAVGHMTKTFVDASRNNRSIQTEIYYPAVTAGNNTTAASGDYPVIVFGHGFVMAWDAYQNLWNEFVPRGYIMVFPRTEGNAFSTDHQKFGWDLQYLVTQIQNEGNLGTSLLYNHVAPPTALMGHSMGGGAAFLAADSLCTNGNTNLKTLIGLAPAESTSNGVSSINSATRITVPSLILSGIQDGVTPPSNHHVPMYNALASSCKTILKIIGGGHCYFANSNFNCDFGEGTSSIGIAITRTQQHQVTFDFVNNWLDYTLKDKCGAFNAFQDSVSNSSRITYSQTCAVTLPSENVIQNITACSSFTWSANNNTYTSAGTYSESMTNINGCDSIITLNLTITNPNSGSANVTTCDSYTWSANNATYNSGGVYTSILTNMNGCDSTATLNLTITNPNSGSANVTTCGSYTWSANNTTYNSDGVYTSILTNMDGCDSTATLNLTITNPNSGAASVTTCGSYTWSANNATYNSGGVYTSILTNMDGCDSTATLNLTITNPNSGAASVTTCGSYTWSANNATYNSGGVYTSILTNMNGCDSTATLNLTITNPNSGAASVTTCGSYTWSANNTTYNSGGVYTSILTNMNGCDSTATLNLTITNPNSGAASVTTCGSYTWSANNTTYNSGGVYTSILTNMNGCDSTATLNLTITNPNSGAASVTTCGSYTWSANNTTYNTGGVYTSILTNMNGCDSTATLNLLINQAPSISVTQNGAQLTSNQTGAIYQWLDCDNNYAEINGENDQSFTPGTGNYAVYITMNGCSDTSACYVVDFTGVDNISGKTLTIHPNPTNNMLYINGLNEMDGVKSMDITSALGALVTQFTEVTSEINVNELPAGSYFLNIIHDQGVHIIRFMKY